MKKRDELECVSGVKGRKITMNLGMYVRGVWLCGVVSINMISIDIINNNPEACVSALFGLFVVLRCCAAALRQTTCIAHHTVHCTCCFLSM